MCFQKKSHEQEVFKKKLLGQENKEEKRKSHMA